MAARFGTRAALGPDGKSRTGGVLMDAVPMDTVQPLAGQVAVITGAGRGIGAAIAR